MLKIEFATLLGTFALMPPFLGLPVAAAVIAAHRCFQSILGHETISLIEKKVKQL